MFNFIREYKRLRVKNMELKASNAELRDEFEEKSLIEYRLNKRVYVLEKAIEDIKNEVRKQQFNNFENFSNKIKTILAELESKLISQK